MPHPSRRPPKNTPAPAPGWCGWRVLPGVDTANTRVQAEILDGGQAFRWQREASDTWLGLWEGNVARVRYGAQGWLEWSAPEALVERVARTLPAYLAADCDFAALADALPWRSDPHLARCLEEFRGLRILRQPFGETLLGFLCSATKQIVQIKQMLALLAERHGTAIVPGFHRLPTWAELAGIPETELRQCRLGFRARFISDTARFLASHSGWLEETAQLPYGAAKARLGELPGVGGKIADCVLLFGAGRFEAFPVDTWILKALARHYGLAGWKPEQAAHFGRVHFGPGAGVAQQYLFAWERSSPRENFPAPGNSTG